LKKLKIINKSSDIIIGDKIELADTFYLRLKGLLGRTKLSEGEGILLVPCSAIHCIGMKFPIDVIFLDEDKKVIGLKENMASGSRGVKKDAKYVLEVEAGIIKEKQVKIGDELEFEESLA